MSKRTIAMALLILGIVALMFLFFVKPGGDTIYPKCPTRVFTGLNCPGCGTLRAIHSLLHLEFKEAVKFNLLTVILAPLLLYGFAGYLIESIFGKELPNIFTNKIVWWSIFILVIAFTVLRNIPVYPFSLFKS